MGADRTTFGPSIIVWPHNCVLCACAIHVPPDLRVKAHQIWFAHAHEAVNMETGSHLELHLSAELSSWPNVPACRIALALDPKTK